jgi:hypothetical protein
MGTVSNRFGWYLAVLQLFFTLCWTVYVIYLPQLTAAAGIAPKAVVLILLLDQAIFTVCDFATGIVADRVTRVLGKLGVYVVAATALSCAAFLLMPMIAGLGAWVLLGSILLWTVTSSALRAPPLMLLGKYARKPAIPFLSALAMLGYGIAGALGPYLTVALRGVDPRIPFAAASVVLMAHHARHGHGRAPADRGRARESQSAGALLRHHDDTGNRVRARHDRAGARLPDALRPAQRAALPEVHQGAAIAMADAGVLDRL